MRWIKSGEQVNFAVIQCGEKRMEFLSTNPHYNKDLKSFLKKITLTLNRRWISSLKSKLDK